eukprot:TRINITY_DN26363_c0_g1_i1.p1 TRINITY_DN26363_c0_g1~~TRINITY_DN26363_c0_g1_i1.p1  ORF type:complete len:656 (+),score=138.05 TRINITY_DN26363_c0_g1_i1:91-2058(+)
MLVQQEDAGPLSSGGGMGFAGRTSSQRFKSQQCRMSQRVYEAYHGVEDDDDLEDLSLKNWSGMTLRQKLQWFCGIVVRATGFEMVMAAVLIASALLTGFEQHHRLSGASDDSVTKLYYVLENVFLLAFILELLLRFGAFGVRRCLSENAIRFDLVVVIVSAAMQWFVEPLAASMEGGMQVTILRLARLLRVSRLVRLTIKFKTLWMLLQGLVSSASAVLYTLVTLVAITYIMGIVIVDLLSEHELAVGPDADPDFREAVRNNFSSLPLTMLTLVSFVTCDGVTDVYTPLLRKDPKLVPIFMVSLVTLGIVLMNLLTAVVVNRAAEHVLEDREASVEVQRANHERLLQTCTDLFRDLVQDGHHLRRSDITGLNNEQRTTLENLVGMLHPLELFNYLDVDGSGAIDVEEFCDGVVAKANGRELHMQINRMDKTIRLLQHDLQRSLEDINAAVMQMRPELVRLHSAIFTNKSRDASPSEANTDVPQSISCMQSESSRVPYQQQLEPTNWQAEMSAIVDTDLKGLLSALESLAEREKLVANGWTQWCESTAAASRSYNASNERPQNDDSGSFVLRLLDRDGGSDWTATDQRRCLPAKAETVPFLHPPDSTPTIPEGKGGGTQGPAPTTIGTSSTATHRGDAAPGSPRQRRPPQADAPID